MSLLLALALSTSANAADQTITAIRLDAGSTPGLCPGKFVEVKLFATLDTGKEVRVKESDVAAYTRTWDITKTGKSLGIYMPMDPRAGWGKAGTYTVTSVADPSLTASVNVPMRYDCPVEAIFRGQGGASGRSGQAGDDTHIGGQGGYGSDGGPGPEVAVTVDAVKEPASGVLVRRISVTEVGSDKTTWYAATEDTQVLIAAVGGSGGSGGYGGSHGGAGGVGGFGGAGGRCTCSSRPRPAAT